MIKKDQKTKLHQDSVEILEKKLIQLKKDLVKTTQEINRGVQKNTKTGKIIRYQIALINTLIQHKKV